MAPINHSLVSGSTDSIVKRIEDDLKKAQERQAKLTENLEQIIQENNTFRSNRNANNAPSNGTTPIPGMPMTNLEFKHKSLEDKLKRTEKKLEHAEKSLDVFREDFDQQLNDKVAIGVEETKAELDDEIAKCQMMKNDQAKVYQELDSYKLQLEAAEQIITENTEQKKQMELELARLTKKTGR